MGGPIREQGRVKGAALREALRWMRARLGDRQAEAVVARNVYEAAGCRGVATVGISCVSDGAAECRWTTTWSLSQR